MPDVQPAVGSRHHALPSCIPVQAIDSQLACLVRSAHTNQQVRMVIDIWDIETLPSDAKDLLLASDDLLRNYRADELEIAASRPKQHVFWQRRANAFADAKVALETDLAALIANENIRSFHYSRMTDEEIQAISNLGIIPTSKTFLRQRLNGLVANGHLTGTQADEVYAESPLNAGVAYGKRDGLFWTSAFPIPIDDTGVERLLAIWGGEVASWTLDDNGAELGLPAIGLPRIMEIAMPIATAMDGSGAATIAGRLVDLRMADLILSKYRGGIDLYTTVALQPEAVSVVHTEGEQAYADMGRGYPPSFTYWKSDEENGE
ncbi:hypothetical protein HFO91_13650 [Rhizobium leguminosarum]|uniref:hypothetical protein n=1 Tax=Rhizobium leguminosarum TaxID=384 RepID=UPI001C988F1F|nr:hypothetical protein [Rhizobium leguminosarum]MBY5370576.1 hypothetical protein [Rhizobium leguminosarum]MBY5450693.1 hypothetical protein [Rhizobium leguminosarum]